jgi:hypothetical protein
VKRERGTLCSNGEPLARAYVETAVPAPRVEPLVEAERVAIVDPRHTPTLHRDGKPRGAGPRNPDQKILAVPGELRVELPDDLPMTEAQIVIVPPELAARWREEAKMKGCR